MLNGYILNNVKHTIKKYSLRSTHGCGFLAFVLVLLLVCKDPVSPINQNSCGPLTLKHRETHGRVVNTVATDALMLKHQATSIHIAD